jgi:hypothetical protein
MSADPAMHTQIIHQQPGKCVNRLGGTHLSLLCAWGLLIGGSGSGNAAQPSAPSPVTPPVTEHHFVKSAFVNTPGTGKDPFFPTSTRRGAPKPGGPVITESAVPQLALKGISGSKNHRLAIINNKTFEVGEEADLRLGSQIVRVRCVEVRDDGVTVVINGQTQKLLLVPKL